MKQFLCFIAFAAFVISSCEGHGMMTEPVGRASRWRTNSSAPKDWNDNESYCGGFGIQWATHGGKCGICGDNYGLKPPRPHELGGLYGEGVIVENYKSGEQIPVTINLNANHGGYFRFDLCNIDESKEVDECFEKHQLKLTNGEDKLPIPIGRSGYFKTTLQIPKDLVCNHCVLRWTYRTGNTWGRCPDGTGKNGCGPQEHFRSCSDIAIKA